MAYRHFDMTTCPNCAATVPPGGACPRCTSVYASFDQPPVAASASSLAPPPPPGFAPAAQQTYAPPPPGYAPTAPQAYPPQHAYPPQQTYPPQHAYAPPPPWGGQWQGYGYQPMAPAKSGKATTGLVLGIIGLFVLPIILCPIGIVLGVQAQKQGDRRGRTAVVVSSVCLVAGMILGVIVNNALKNQ